MLQDLSVHDSEQLSNKKNDYKMEEQSWFFTQIYNIYQMDKIWQNACVLWIRQ